MRGSAGLAQDWPGDKAIATQTSMLQKKQNGWRWTMYAICSQSEVGVASTVTIFSKHMVAMGAEKCSHHGWYGCLFPVSMWYIITTNMIYQRRFVKITWPPNVCFVYSRSCIENGGDYSIDIYTSVMLLTTACNIGVVQLFVQHVFTYLTFTWVRMYLLF